jgi:uncharacterized protein
MIIDLSSVQTTPKPLTADVDAARIDLEDDGTVNGSARFEGEVFREGTKVHLRGEIAVDVDIVCSRCAEPLTERLEIPFEDVFVNAAEETATADLEVEGTDLDEEVVESNEIDLSEVIREQILLNLPEQVLCKEDCKGLCPQCGANHNLLDCDCDKEDIDPRWAALKNLN